MSVTNKAMVREESPKPKKASGSIVIIDTDEFLARLFGHKLEEGGYRVNVIHDWRRATKDVAETRPDLIIMEILLDGVDGFELLRNIKSIPVSAPIIILTRVKNEDGEQASRELGAYAFLCKSECTPQEVFEGVREALKRGAA